MAREIKFRGKALDGPWEFGDLHMRFCKHPHIHSMSGATIYIDPNTVGQFTGLHDKNGNEIYEGDIVKTKYGRPCVIEWLSTICFVGFDLRPEVPISKYKQPDEYDLYNSDNLEVIGNIHDNPELLKED